ncbi:MAG: diguanylate cyclase [Chloroflexi bacterium]|nr:diguanylate cyclase [Chloroflexota bacterium]
MDDKHNNILLIEDDSIQARLIKAILSKNSCALTMEWVDTLQAGLERLALGGIAVVLLDLGLPDSQGLDTFSRLYEQTSSIPIIILSGNDDEMMSMTAVQAGAQDYLIKEEVNRALLVRTLCYAIERKKVLSMLQESQARYTRAVRGARDGLWDWNLETNKIHFSPRWKAMIGYEEEEIGDSPDEWFNRVNDKDRQQLQQGLNAHLQGGTSHFENEYRILHKGGIYHWMLCRGLVERGSNGKARYIAGSQTDIRRRKTIEHRLQHYAFYDPLTGLANRYFFEKHLGEALKRVEIHPEYLLGVLFLDLDHFKEINDTLGHAAGDKLLVTVADRLQTCVRANDTAARFGGDEFAILLDDIESAEEAWSVAKRIQSLMTLPFEVEDKKVSVSISIGIAINTRRYKRPQDLLHDADIAMYQAKANRKAEHILFNTGMLIEYPTTRERSNE